MVTKLYKIEGDFFVVVIMIDIVAVPETEKSIKLTLHSLRLPKAIIIFSFKEGDLNKLYICINTKETKIYL